MPLRSKKGFFSVFLNTRLCYPVTLGFLHRPLNIVIQSPELDLYFLIIHHIKNIKTQMNNNQ